MESIQGDNFTVRLKRKRHVITEEELGQTERPKIVITEEELDKLGKETLQVFTPGEEAQFWLESNPINTLGRGALRQLVKRFHPDNPDGPPDGINKATAEEISRLVNSRYDDVSRTHQQQ